MRLERGQATVEWIGLILLVSLLFAGMLAVGVRVPGVGLAESIVERITCAVAIGDRCAAGDELAGTYGEELAAVVRAHAPALAYARGSKWVPSDFRECMEVDCAASPGVGRIASSVTGEPATAFTRVIDCREPPAVVTVAGDESAPDCTGKRQGNLYLAYWFYYPDSTTFEGVPLLEEAGYHPHDWQSFQIRIDRDGRADARASSHHGHNHRRSPANWASDAGLGSANEVVEWVGARPPGGWGTAAGWLAVSAGSQAGNVTEGRGDSPAFSLPGDIRLVPLEEVVATERELPSFSPIIPPWGKALWTDPEARHTG